MSVAGSHEDSGETHPQADDFKRIPGIGPVIERQLHAAGVLTYAQLAALSPRQIADLVDHLPLLSVERIARQDWPGRARDLARQAALPDDGAATPTARGRRYATFTVELQLDARRRVAQTRIVHLQDGLEDVWSGWSAARLMAFLGAHADAPPGAEDDPERTLQQPALRGAGYRRRTAPWSARPRPSVPPGAAYLDDPDDDLSVSNADLDLDERFGIAPSYGEMGAPAELDRRLSLEPVGRSSGTLDAAPDAAPAPDDAPLLDAWYANYGHPALLTLLRRTNIAQVLAGQLADSDGRAQITATDGYPWRCMCALTITAADGTRWRGSGWLAGPRTVITAGHCLYMPLHGGWVRQVEVVPGCNANRQPYGACIATSFRSVRGWTRKQRWEYNYGAIMLPADRAFGNLLGRLGYLNLSDHELRDLPINSAGYPTDKPQGSLWYSAQQIDRLSARTISYAVTTLGGASGAPIWQLKSGRRYVVGIHTNGDLAGQSAVRLSTPVFANLTAWAGAGA